MLLNSFSPILLFCFTVIYLFICSAAQVLQITITHSHMTSTPHSFCYWAFISHLSLIRQSGNNSLTSRENTVLLKRSDPLYGTKATISEKDFFFPKLRFTRPAWITAVFLAQALLQTLMMKISCKLFLPSKSFPLIHWPGAWEGRKCRSLKNDLSAPMRAVSLELSSHLRWSCFGSKGQTGPGQMSSGGSFRYFHPFSCLRIWTCFRLVGCGALCGCI